MSEPYELRLELRGLPKLQSGAFGSFWARRSHDKKWHEEVALLARLYRPRAPLPKAIVHCTRFSPREPDYDNLVSSFKPLIDALIGVVIVDDSASHLSRSYRWEKARRGDGRVTIDLRGVA